MGIWDKILGGVETFFKGLASEVSMITSGVAAGMAAGGPLGALIGGIGGMVAGSIFGGYHLASYIYNTINDDGTPSEPTGLDAVKHAGGAAGSAALAIAKSGALGPGAAATASSFTAAINGGGTVRQAMSISGMTQFPGAITAGGLQAASNRADASLGVSPVRAIALGSIYRPMYSGAAHSNRGAVYHQIMSASAPVSASAMPSTSASRFGVGAGEAAISNTS